MPRPTDPATPAQKDYLRDLVLEADGDIDSDWLDSLTVVQASAEIKRYGGGERK